MPIVMRVDFATYSWLNAFASAVSLTIVSQREKEILRSDEPFSIG